MERNPTIDLSPLTEYAVQLVTKEIMAKEDRGQAPFMARLDEMLPKVGEDFTEVMRNLVREKMVTCHKDLNGKIMFEFTQPKR